MTKNIKKIIHRVNIVTNNHLNGGFQEGAEFAKKLFMEREKTPELVEKL